MIINVTVSASLSTDFYLEVPDEASEEEIKELAKKEVILPHMYPSVVDSFLMNNMRIKLQGIDSMLKDWNVDEVEYIINDGRTSEGEQPNA